MRAVRRRGQPHQVHHLWRRFDAETQLSVRSYLEGQAHAWLEALALDLHRPSALFCHALQVVPFYQAEESMGPGARYRALVLDSSYRPIDVVSWQRAICLDLFDKVDAARRGWPRGSVAAIAGLWMWIAVHPVISSALPCVEPCPGWTRARAAWLVADDVVLFGPNGIEALASYRRIHPALERI